MTEEDEVRSDDVLVHPADTSILDRDRKRPACLKGAGLE
jgi:hypothetical protein